MGRAMPAKFFLDEWFATTCHEADRQGWLDAEVAIFANNKAPGQPFNQRFARQNVTTINSAVSNRLEEAVRDQLKRSKTRSLYNVSVSVQKEVLDDYKRKKVWLSYHLQ